MKINNSLILKIFFKQSKDILNPPSESTERYTEGAQLITSGINKTRTTVKQQ